MWLIRTRTGELKHFNSFSDVKGGYAILSHVWQGEEMSFQELRALASDTKESDSPDDTPRSRASAKIRECCKLAESHGYEWLWIDTCCIDRTSSAELSEAVNSMFSWYSHASVCYAYLFDVLSWGSLMRRGPPYSKWFTRGWTLQELIAPRSLVFLSKDWKVLGTKASLASVLEQITGIDADVLTFRRSVSEVSVARRMWWASSRHTTRVEDRAYSLMGLFGVHMSTIYGEGDRAFRRLQEEILKRTSDQTLFAWGNVLPAHSTPFRERFSFDNFHDDSHLFAPSPASFRNSGTMRPLNFPVAVKHIIRTLKLPPGRLDASAKDVPHTQTTADGSYVIPSPDMSFTTYGARSRMLVLESSKDNSVLAVCALACWDDATNSCIGLLLRRYRQYNAKFKYPRYHVGITVRGKHKWMGLSYRLAQVDWAPHVLSFSGGPITVAWKQIYISHRPPSHRSTLSDPKRYEAEFRVLFPKWLEVELRKQGFEADRPLPTDETDAHRLSNGGPLGIFKFTHSASGESFRLQIGQCHSSPWATVSIVPKVSHIKPPATEVQDSPLNQPAALLVQPAFSCDKNRLSSWLNATKTFGDSKRRIQLTFTRAANIGGTHLLDVRLGGSTYWRLNRRSDPGQKALHTMSRTAVRLCSRR
ncbi:HET-domain-containing protein [Lentinus tigrinus ALCF2SS1-7]|uniref:HET-domain-containing protein n=1 Tax=Lentinus tigrinus ALCF2SS1-6 TaxID=1328759 RepID=A0A5C2S3B3_9APHY|nr:HET-domain-containing protein [Lentinus tigrinus ALCF2SS1-6]RPD70420.1 HET-domain-containing protein [Lentinus tigrinus ALCF2SS1-7]